MSTFSSVIHKPGKKFAPKPTPRRSLQRPSQQVSARPTRSPATPISDSSAAQLSNNANASSRAPNIENATGEAAATPSQVLSSLPTTSQETETSPSLGNGQFISPLRSRASDEQPPNQVAQADATTNGGDQVSQRRHVRVRSSNALQQRDKDWVPAPTFFTSPQQSKRKRAVPVPEVATPLAAPSALPIPLPKSSGSLNARKKRKTTPLATPAYIFAQGTIINPPASNQQSPSEPESTTSRISHRRAQPTDRLLQQATSQAAAVSTLAEAIDGNTRATRESSLSTRRPTSADVTSSTIIQGKAPVEAPLRNRRPRQKKTLGEMAAEIVADAVNEPSVDAILDRRRKQTPEGAEDHEIERTEVKMSDLCKETNLGKKSRRESEMQKIDWPAVRKLQKEEAAEAERRRLAGEKEQRTKVVTKDSAPPRVVEFDIDAEGNIAVVEESRHFDRQAQVIEDAARLDQNVNEVDHLTKRVNQNTVGRKRGVGAGTRWDESMTNRFYKGIRMFGTDFMMISSMFPGLTRRHIKLKYVKEEKTNLAELHRNLVSREPVDLKEFEEMTAKVYEDPKKVQDELEATEKRLRAEDEERRAREYGQPHPEEEEETILQSREQGSAEPEEILDDHREDTVAIEGDVSAKENRFGSVASRIVQEASGPKKKRKQIATSKKREAPKRGKRPMEGVEERLGGIDEVTR